MANAALVERDVAAGKELLESLDAAGFPAFAALWLLRPDTADWTFYLGSTDVDRHGRHDTYARVQQIIGTQAQLPLRDITLVGASDPFIRMIAGAIRVDGVSDVRFTNNVINGVLIPDALIYRLQPPDDLAPQSVNRPRRSPAPTRRTNAPRKGAPKRRG